MKGNFKLIGSALILAIAVTLVTAAPAEKEVPADTKAESGSKAESSSPSQETVPAPNSADTRADVPASTGESGGAPVSKPTAVVGTFFDNIFNIPTSVLRAVNQFLNNNIKIGQGSSSKTAAVVPAAAPVAPNTPTATSAPASGDVQTEAPPAGSTPVAAGGAPSKPAARSNFFDNIFNIPISAINSVNSLITGRKFGENGDKAPINNNQ